MPSTPNENIVENLDVLLFDSEEKFLCWRTTFKINGKLRTTLPIGKDYDAYFLANCRSFIEKMLPDEVTEGQYIGKADWEETITKYSCIYVFTHVGNAGKTRGERWSN